MNDVVYFESEVFNLSQINPLVSRYKLFIAYPDEPANNYIFSKEVLIEMSSTIKGCPIVAGFMNNEDGSLIGGHAGDLAVNKYGIKTRTPETIPVGFAAYDVEPWWEDHNGKMFLTTYIYIWDGRFPELSNLSNRKIYHSAEVAIEERQEGRYKVVKEAYAIGLCLLENVEPAFSGSEIQKFTLKFDHNYLEKLKKEYDTFASKYDSLDFSIPESVKKSAKTGLDLYQKYNKGGTSVSLANARFLQKNDKITPQKVKGMSKYFMRLDGMSIDGQDEANADWITYNLWGGCEASKWSIELSDKMKEKDKEVLSFFKKEDEELVDKDLNKEEFAEEEKENKEVEEKEDEAKEKEEEKEEEMSSNENIDASAYQVLNEKAAEQEKKLLEQEDQLLAKDVELSKMKEEMSSMQAEMAKMKEEMTVYMEENCSLKEFKKSIENQNKEFTIASVLDQVKDVLPQEELEKCKASAEKFSVEEMSIWENEVQALAFKFTKGISDKKGFSRIAIPNNTQPPKTKKGIWD